MVVYRVLPSFVIVGIDFIESSRYANEHAEGNECFAETMAFD